MAEPYPWFYAVNDRPVKFVQLATGEVEVLVYDFDTGELVRDMSYLSRVFDHGKDIDKLDEVQFEGLVEQLRGRRQLACKLTKTVSIPKQRARLGLTPDEADTLALELAKIAEELHDPGMKAFDVFDVDADRARRREWLENAMPVHEVDVGPFEIDVYPVTNAQWAAYVADTGAQPAARFGDGPKQAFVTGVSWREAEAYAHHYGLELPTEAEWEVAARNDRSFFTWGNAYFPFGRIAFRGPVDEPYIVGTRRETASNRGIHDLLGEFGEYCSDRFAPYPGADLALWERHNPGWRDQRVQRGGPHPDVTCVSRRGVPANERRARIKFRCVRRG